MNPPNVRVTRIRSDIAHSAMTTDFVLQASSDQSELSNIRNVTQSINETCPIYGNSCSVIGYGTVAQANAAATSSGGSAAFACNAASVRPIGGPVTLGGLAAVAGLVVVRLRRRRKTA
jgi:hypothetical protein